MGQCYTPRSLTSTLGLEIEHATSPGQEGGRFQTSAAAGLQHVEYARAVDPKRLKPRTLPVGLSVISCIPKWAERRLFLPIAQSGPAYLRLLTRGCNFLFIFFARFIRRSRGRRRVYQTQPGREERHNKKKHAASETFLVAYFSAISFSFFIYIYIIFNLVLQVCQYEVAQEQQTLHWRISHYLKKNKLF